MMTTQRSETVSRVLKERVEYFACIHIGPSSDVHDYWREAERADRDGVLSHAILYCYPGCTVGHVSPVMKRYAVNDDICQRSLLLLFLDEIMTSGSCIIAIVVMCACTNALVPLFLSTGVSK